MSAWLFSIQVFASETVYKTASDEHIDEHVDELAGDRPLAGASDALVNERIPGKAIDLEAHWGIDCQNIRHRYAQYTKDKKHDASLHMEISESLQKCGFIYNVIGSSHYRLEPNYFILRKQLNELVRE